MVAKLAALIENAQEGPFSLLACYRLADHEERPVAAMGGEEVENQLRPLRWPVVESERDDTDGFSATMLERSERLHHADPRVALRGSPLDKPPCLG